MTDAGEKLLRDRVKTWRNEHYLKCNPEPAWENLVHIGVEAARAEIERAAEIADRFKQPWIGEEIRKLKE